MGATIKNGPPDPNDFISSPLAAESLSPNQTARRQIGKMLLDAGADPTLDIGETMKGGSPLVQALSRGLEKLVGHSGMITDDQDNADEHQRKCCACFSTAGVSSLIWRNRCLTVAVLHC